MVSKAEQSLLALKELENTTGGILMSAIVTLDGLVIASTTSDMVSRETFAAYSAVVFRRADDAMGELSNEFIDLLIYESKKYRIISTRAGKNALLIALSGKEVQMEIILLEMQNTAIKIKEMLD